MWVLTEEEEEVSLHRMELKRSYWSAPPDTHTRKIYEKQ